MSDLTDERLATIRGGGPGSVDRVVDDMFAMATEIQRHRASKRLSAERVREVVREVVVGVLSRLPTNVGGENYGPLSEHIADRVVEQLAVTAEIASSAELKR